MPPNRVRTIPDFRRRCQILGHSFPSSRTVSLKIVSLFLEGGSRTFTFELDMKVEEAIALLKGSQYFISSPGLLQEQGNSGETEHSREHHLGFVVLPRKESNLQEGVWLDPLLPIGNYDFRDDEIVHLKEIPEEVKATIANSITLRVVVPGEKRRLTTLLSLPKETKVSELLNKINSLRPKHMCLDPKYYGAYLWDATGGDWLGENVSFSSYELFPVDILEVKKRPLYEFDLGEQSIFCDEGTLVDQLIKLVACWISPPVDDPTIYGLLLVPSGKTASFIWLMEEKHVKFFNIKVGDTIEFKKKPAMAVEEADHRARVSLVVKWIPFESYEMPRKQENDGGPTRLGGEVPLYRYPKVICYRYNATNTGEVWLTNCHFIFAATPTENYDELFTKIPYTAISRVERPNIVASSPDVYFLDFFCKDLRTLRFAFNKNVIARHFLIRILESMIYPRLVECFFAYFFEWEPPSTGYTFNGWNLYDPVKEFEKLEIPSHLWRISTINEKYEYSDTYPSKLIVPKSVDDEELREVFQFRSKGRIPVLTYFHSNTATITRCSQPMVGISGARSTPDEKLVENILRTNTYNNSRLYLFDARPKTNAIANQAMGYGFEGTGANQGYSNCVLEFLGIDNIHHMRDSLMKLAFLCASSVNEDNSWLSGLESTRWLEHLKLMLSAAVRIAQKVETEGASVLVHCSDGWDRTAQLTSLAQLFLNPYYRTLEGFELLIEKEWLSFGYRFQQRTGHGERNYMDEQRSPIFLQFIDCVWQITRQFPCSFEFNEKFLITVMDSLYSSHYGTFLFNCEKERRQNNLAQKTVSLWTVINSAKETYLNPFYLPDNGILFPSPSVSDLSLWRGYYFRWYKRTNPLTAELRGLQLKLMYEAMKQRVQELEAKFKDSSSSTPVSASPSPAEAFRRLGLRSSGSPTLSHSSNNIRGSTEAGGGEVLLSSATPLDEETSNLSSPSLQTPARTTSQS